MLRYGQNVLMRALVLIATADVSGFQCDRVAVSPVSCTCSQTYAERESQHNSLEQTLNNQISLLLVADDGLAAA